MERKKALYYLYKVYKLLNSNKIPIILKKIRSRRGETDMEIIWLNPSEDILPTLIHECLHILYPNWSETKIRKYETQIFNQLTQRQIKNLLLRLAFYTNNIYLE